MTDRSLWEVFAPDSELVRDVSLLEKALERRMGFVQLFSLDLEAYWVSFEMTPSGIRQARLIGDATEKAKAAVQTLLSSREPGRELSRINENGFILSQYDPARNRFVVYDYVDFDNPGLEFGARQSKLFGASIFFEPTTMHIAIAIAHVGETGEELLARALETEEYGVRITRVDHQWADLRSDHRVLCFEPPPF